MNKLCETRQENKGQIYNQHSHMDYTHRHNTVGHPAKTYFHKLSVDTGCPLEDQPMTNSKRWLSAQLDDNDDDDDNDDIHKRF